MKTIYTLRCFYGEALQSGEDLKAELKSFGTGSQNLAAALLILLAVFFFVPAKAAETSAAPSASQKISSTDLEHAIAQTVHGQKYAWRMPREKVVESDSDEGVVARFFDKISAMFRRWTDPILKWLKQWWKNLFKRQPTVSHENGGSGYGWIMSAQMLLYVLVAVVASVLVIFLYRVWRGRRRTPTVLAEAIVPVPDITDENIRADQLPEDGWINLARELLERGEFRLAMRAFYLASLAHLAGRNLISIARFKSNRDYQRELGRRAHSFQNLLIIYGDNLLVFERIWYGRHAVDRDLVGQFAANVEKIKGAG